MYYKIYITQTSKKPYGKNEDSAFTIFNNFEDIFANLQLVKNYLKEAYKNCKKVKMYRDDKNGNSKHIGYIYHFRNKDWSHNTPEWIQEDWIEITKVQEETVKPFLYT